MICESLMLSPRFSFTCQADVHCCCQDSDDDDDDDDHHHRDDDDDDHHHRDDDDDDDDDDTDGNLNHEEGLKSAMFLQNIIQI